MSLFLSSPMVFSGLFLFKFVLLFVLFCFIFSLFVLITLLRYYMYPNAITSCKANIKYYDINHCWNNVDRVDGA